MTQDPGPRPRPASAPPIPWLGLVLALACALFSLRAQVAERELEASAEAAYAPARAYFLEHAYLEPSPELAARIPPGELSRSLEAHRAERAAAGMVVPAGIQVRRQHKLDTLLEEAAASLPPLPARSAGVLPAEGLSAAWLAHPLLHRSPWHLWGNLALLLFLAVYLERALGRLGFACSVAAAGLAGALAYCLAATGQERTALVGTSPLLAGLWLSFVCLHWRHRGKGFFEVGLVVGALWLGLPPWAELRWSLADVAPYAPGAGAPWWSVFAGYAGGALGGGLTALVWLALAPEPGAGRSPLHPLVRRALRSRDEGRPREALEDLREYLAANPESLEAATLVWELASELGRGHGATAARIRVIELLLRRGRSPEALVHWAELCAGGIPLEAESRFLLGVALALREDGRGEAAAEALRCALERGESRESRALAASIARAAHGLDSEVAEVAAWRALGRIELSLGERQALEDLIAEVLTQRRAGGGRFEPAALAVAEAARVSTAPLAQPQLASDIAGSRLVECVLAVPLGVGDEGLDIESEDGWRKRVRWERIEAVAVAAVKGLGSERVLLLDLVLNWMSTRDRALRVIRLRSDRYDPRSLVGSRGAAVDAMRELMETLLERSQAVALPDENSALGRPFAEYADLAHYERGALLAARGADAEPAQGRSA